MCKIRVVAGIFAGLLSGCGHPKELEPVVRGLSEGTADTVAEVLRAPAQESLCDESVAPGGWSMGPAPVPSAGTESALVLCGNAVRSSQLVLELGASEGFRVTGAQHLSGELSGPLIAESVVSVLRQIIDERNFSLHFASVGGQQRLAELKISPFEQAQQTMPLADSFALGVESDAPRDPTPEERALWQNDYGDLEGQLEDSNEQLRRSALNAIVAEGEGLSVLDRALLRETSAEMRIKLLEKIDESGSVVALQSMVRHLRDPDADVVVTSVELIADWHDEELVLRHVQPLLQHGAAAVREAAQDAIDRFR